MYRRTFDVIARYVSKAQNVTIQFDTDGGAHADMQKDILHLPKNISNSHAYAALALLMHESAHIHRSKIIPIDQVVKTKAEFQILNAIEDVRIDMLNFKLLPNVHEFYQQLVDEVYANVDKKTDLATRALCYAIMKAEGFNPMARFGSDARTLGITIENDILSGTWHIGAALWADLRTIILEIKRKLSIKDDPPLTPQEIAGLHVGVNVDGPLKVDQAIHPDKIFNGKPGDGMTGGTDETIGSLAMEDQCAQSFKEILNVKERKVVNSGMTLDSDNLTAFKTRNINELFKDEKTIKRRKSKIFFLLDASGSMGSKLIDGNSRANVVARAVKTLTNIIDEVTSLEGLNVDWEVGAFRSGYIPLNKQTWQHEYTVGGGTRFEGPFKQVMEAMLKDWTIEGKRIIVCFTDGDVMDSEIENVKQEIISHYSDVRSLIIAVGSAGHSAIVRDITGDNIIMAEDNAVYVIMETIKTML